jgi:hypothetical protein
VFVLWALDQTPLWDDLPFVNRAAAAVQSLLPGYAGEVRVGLCRAFDPVIPRWWYANESGCGAWVLGVNWLERWLDHFGDDDGLTNGDVAWARAALARTPELTAEPAEYRMIMRSETGANGRRHRSRSATAGDGARRARGGAASDTDGPCPVCLELDRTCQRCVQRGQRALGWLEAGESLCAIAVRMRLSPARVARLVELTRDRRAVDAEKKKRPRLTAAQAIIERARACDPELTRAEIARRMIPQMHPADFRSHVRLCTVRALAPLHQRRDGKPADPRARSRPTRSTAAEHNRRTGLAGVAGAQRRGLAARVRGMGRRIPYRNGEAGASASAANDAGGMVVLLTYRLIRAAALVSGLLCATALSLRCGLGVEVVKRAAGIPEDVEGVGKFVNGARALVLPALAMTAAVCPLAVIAGGLVVLFGGRRGMVIIGSALGVLLLLGSVTGIVE